MASSVRANWKGYLKISNVTCAVALYTAASTAERLSFHTVNRATGNRVQRRFVDSETGKPVDREQQVKGYEVSDSDYVILEPDEITAAIPVSDKTITVDSFIPCTDIDSTYFDKPYYLAPSNKNAQDAFYLIREGMKNSSVAAIGQTVLFRRLRTLLIRAHGPGLIATTLNYAYEVRSAKEAFEDIPKLSIKGEMLDLAKHIIQTKLGEFSAKDFDDRYEDALAELVKAKVEGKPIKAPKPVKNSKVVDLMDALRQSAGANSGAKPKAAKKRPAAKKVAQRNAKKAVPRRKAS